MEAHGGQCHDEPEQGGKQERRPLPIDRNPVGKIGEPRIGEVPGRRKRKDHPDANQHEEFPRDQYDQAADTRANHLANTDLLCALFRGERRKAKQSEAGNNNGEAGEGVKI